MYIAIINQSTKITTSDASSMVAACNKQLSRDIAPAWNRIAISVKLVKDVKSLTSDALPIVILDNSDQVDALGYHSEDNDLVFGRVFVNPVLNAGGVVLYDVKNPQNISVASVLSHEIAELFCDPFVNSWCDGPKLKDGSEYALEVCDPVESDSYVIKSSLLAKSVSVSNFVFPAWFDEESEGKKLDYLGNVKAPFTMSKNGYMVIRNGPGSEKAVFGEIYPDWKKATKGSAMARTTKRGIKG